MKYVKMVINKILRTIYRNNKEKYISLQFENSMGYKPNLKNPKSFNEKICYQKAYYYNPLYEKCADKYAVREYVKSKGLEKILTKLYGVYESTKEIDFDKLPESFVLKTTHSTGGGVVIVKNKNDLDIKSAFKDLNHSLSHNLYKKGYEWQYKNIKPRIIAEEYIKPDESELMDYKFFCFNGKVQYVYLAYGTASNDSSYFLDFYDKDFKWVNVRREGHKSYGQRPKPKMFDELKKVAEKLSEDFAFVRVDLYCENKKIYFGELTFTPGNGVGKFIPDSFDFEMGKLFDIKKLK